MSGWMAKDLPGWSGRVDVWTCRRVELITGTNNRLGYARAIAFLPAALSR
jgi:hypothetical protein